MYPHEFNKLKIEELGGYGRYGNIILFTQFFSIKKSIKKKPLTATIKEGKIKIFSDKQSYSKLPPDLLVKKC